MWVAAVHDSNKANRTLQPGIICALQCRQAGDWRQWVLHRVERAMEVSDEFCRLPGHVTQYVLFYRKAINVLV